MQFSPKSSWGIIPGFRSEGVDPPIVAAARAEHAARACHGL